MISPVERWFHRPASISCSSQRCTLSDASSSSEVGTNTRRIGARVRDIARPKSCGGANRGKAGPVTEESRVVVPEGLSANESRWDGTGGDGLEKDESLETFVDAKRRWGRFKGLSTLPSSSDMDPLWVEYNVRRHEDEYNLRSRGSEGGGGLMALLFPNMESLRAFLSACWGDWYCCDGGDDILEE